MRRLLLGLKAEIGVVNPEKTKVLLTEVNELAAIFGDPTPFKKCFSMSQ